MRTVWRENILKAAKTKYLAPLVTSSYLTTPTGEDWEVALALYNEGQCNHSLVFDIELHDFDERKCALCYKSLGFV
jgi:hypothetical protein